MVRIRRGCQSLTANNTYTSGVCSTWYLVHVDNTSLSAAGTRLMLYASSLKRALLDRRTLGPGGGLPRIDLT